MTDKGEALDRIKRKPSRSRECDANEDGEIIVIRVDICINLDLIITSESDRSHDMIRVTSSSTDENIKREWQTTVR